jgi:glucose dehydrogenase
MLDFTNPFPPPGRPAASAIFAAAAIPGISFTPSGQPAKPVKQIPDTPKEKEWRDYAGGPEDMRFIPLSQIDKSNVSQMDVAWAYPCAETRMGGGNGPFDPD